MSLYIEQMDHSLFDGDNMRGPFNDLTRSRVVAQVLGQNMQDCVAQAVHGKADLIDELFLQAEKLGYPDPYKLFSWISLFMAHGDGNCANYFTWAGLLMEGNSQAFSAARDILCQTLDQYDTKQPIHSELDDILTHCPFTTHFSAQRIPSVSWRKRESTFILDWSGSLRGTVGHAPRFVVL